MIVKNIRERDQFVGKSDPSLKLGEKYLVFGVLIDYLRHKQMFVLRRVSDACPVNFDAKYFEIVDDRIPEDWQMENLEFEMIRIQPTEFSGNFWDCYHDGEDKHQKIFEHVAKKIEKFHECDPLVKK